MEQTGLTSSEWISIADIIVTSLIGLWIAVGLQKNLTKSRYLREYFMTEITSIRDDYREFFNELIAGNLSAVAIKDYFKILSCRIQDLDKNIHRKYRLKNNLLKAAYTDLQHYVTGEDDFNEQFQSEKVTFKGNYKQETLKLNNAIIEAITQRILDINEAREYIKIFGKKF